jgi:hypothetical protein
VTDIETAGSAPPDVVLNGANLLQSADGDFADLAHTLSVEDLLDAGTFLTAVSKVSSVRVGLVAYEIRQQTPDGTWGRRVADLATEWEVSERTIHRWMRGAQDHFGLELTPAQANAEAAPAPDGASAEAAEWTDPDEELADAGFDLEDLDDYDPELAGLGGGIPDGGSLMDRMNDEAGWGDKTLPSADYENPEDAAPAARPVALPPDPDWVAFTAEGIRRDHPDYGDVESERSAKARWARQIEEQPLDLLEDLETVYGSRGEEVPMESVEALYAAEERKAIKPDEVTEGGGKKKRAPAGPKLCYDVAEKMLQTARQLHQQVHGGLKDGTVTDKQAAAMLPHLQPLPHTIQGLTKMAKTSRERALAEQEPVEDRIAATQAAETHGDDGEPVEIAQF